MERGKLIVVEGIDGCGKDTQIDLIYSYMLMQGMRVMKRSNISDLASGKYLRKILSDTNLKLNNFELAKLFITELIEVSSEIDILLEEGINVVCSRWFYSTLAYAGTTDEEYVYIQKLISESNLLNPDLTIYLNVTPSTAMERINSRGENKEIYEEIDKLSLIHERYYKVFSDMINKAEPNLRVFLADDSIDTVFTKIKKHII